MEHTGTIQYCSEAKLRNGRSFCVRTVSTVYAGKQTQNFWSPNHKFEAVCLSVWDLPNGPKLNAEFWLTVSNGGRRPGHVVPGGLHHNVLLDMWLSLTSPSQFTSAKSCHDPDYTTGSQLLKPRVRLIMTDFEHTTFRSRPHAVMPKVQPETLPSCWTMDPLNSSGGLCRY